MAVLDAQLVWSKGRWERRDYPTIMSGRVVRYNVGYGAPGEAEISASRDAVCIDNVSFCGAGAHVAVLDIIERAWRQHLHLAKAHGSDPLPEPEMVVGEKE